MAQAQRSCRHFGKGFNWMYLLDLAAQEGFTGTRARGMSVPIYLIL
jgi:hypothetical protein